MTELQRYLAEEVAEDHADGIITRREAVRRLGLLGVGTGAAATLLGAAGHTEQPEPPHRLSSGDDAVGMVLGDLFGQVALQLGHRVPRSGASSG